MGDKYFDNVETWNAPWAFIYGDQLKNLANILRQTDVGGYAEGKNLNLRQAARILRVFNFHRLTDYYGNIPYSKALQGIQGEFLPVYDKQSDIYPDLLKELSEAVAALSTSNPNEGFANADIIFNGNITRWKQWGNSLMLRLAMRMSNVNAAAAGPYVTQAVSGVGTMASNADNAWVPMSLSPSEWTNQNGISRAFASGDGGQPSIMSKTLVDALLGPNTASTADDDPRLMVFTWGILKADGTYNVDPLQQRGMPNGLDAGTLDSYLTVLTGAPVSGANAGLYFSRLNAIMLDDDDPYMLMNYAETEFLKAEALERAIGAPGGTAQAHYDAGVRAAMQMYTPYGAGGNNSGGTVAANTAAMTVTDAQVDAYLLNFPYTGTSAQKLAMIGTQMWISKLLNWWEAWADWRRTGLPALTPVNYPGNITSGQIPTKLRLPTHEVATNSANIAAGATTPDDPTGKVWWDGGN